MWPNSDDMLKFKQIDVGWSGQMIGYLASLAAPTDWHRGWTLQDSGFAQTRYHSAASNPTVDATKSGGEPVVNPELRACTEGLRLATRPT